MSFACQQESSLCHRGVRCVTSHTGSSKFRPCHHPPLQFSNAAPNSSFIPNIHAPVVALRHCQQYAPARTSGLANAQLDHTYHIETFLVLLRWRKMAMTILQSSRKCGHLGKKISIQGQFVVWPPLVSSRKRAGSMESLHRIHLEEYLAPSLSISNRRIISSDHQLRYYRRRSRCRATPLQMNTTS
jgi:hypothetical protein